MTIVRLLPLHDIAPQALIIVLHGVGADAASMLPLAQHLHCENPSAAIVIPDAPIPFDIGGGGYQWFSIKGVTDYNRQTRITEARPYVDMSIEQELARYQLNHQNLGICGFSQGAMMALAMASRDNAPRVIASIAGRIATPVPTHTDIPTHIFLSHGDRDPIVPFACMGEAVKAFLAEGYPGQTLTIAVHGHHIAEAQAISVGAFFALTLPLS